jgi:hypothetical protein
LFCVQEHADALTAFKQRIHDAGLQPPAALFINKDVDATLIRFLRARKFNVDHALAMLESELVAVTYPRGPMWHSNSSAEQQEASLG